MTRTNKRDERGGSTGEGDGVTDSVDIFNYIMAGTGGRRSAWEKRVKDEAAIFKEGLV